MLKDISIPDCLQGLVLITKVLIPAQSCPGDQEKSLSKLRITQVFPPGFTQIWRRSPDGIEVKSNKF